ncbi:NAD-dependent epimerase/dehydratase family protein (plasmid) [Azospirillum brasilense]|uniref:NAD-dependent epimerase/dehydratase family protein n=1 Tax=Azospirillum brasilense TaxID=192 RepID=A0A4D8RFF8_AZOBR|nr:NAD-dependent epimerase/dehydratase family protein [Azospirillum brasilense]QCO19884.1 NAD-dependent epimerase/dehydratase family protein [Azospirillum brasilense]
MPQRAHLNGPILCSWLEASLPTDRICGPALRSSGRRGACGRRFLRRSRPSGPFDDFQRTVTTTASLVHTLGRLAPNVRIVFLSSAAVYGNAAPVPLKEDDPCAPVSQYGWHKLLAEKLCQQGAATHGIRCAVIRFFSIYGPGLRKQVLWDVGRRLLTSSGTVDVNATGEETRDFLHIEDMVDLTLLLLNSRLPDPIIINGGTGRAVSLSDLLEMLGKASALRQHPLHRHGAARQSTASPSGHKPSFRSGFMPRRSIEEGILDYALWLRRESAII